jgi:hypothetical protein
VPPISGLDNISLFTALCTGFGFPREPDRASFLVNKNTFGNNDGVPAPTAAIGFLDFSWVVVRANALAIRNSIGMGTCKQ